MGSLGNIPFLRPALAFCLGIGTSLYLVKHAYPWMAVVFYVVLVLAATSFLFGLFTSRSFQILSGIFMLVSLVGLGFTMAYFAQEPWHRNHFAATSTNKYVQLKLSLDEEISAKANSWRCKARVLEGYDSAGSAWKVTGNILVYWPHRSNTKQPSLRYGDEIIVQNDALVMPSAAFPGDFDFKAVMRYKNVQHQLFLNEKGWKLTGSNGKWLFRVAFACRELLVDKLHHLLPAEQAALMASLMIGFREELDQSDLKAFAVSGTTHVLAVSGLHVGLLYLFLVLVFTGKRKTTRLSRFQGVGIILALWAFALVTGLSASVVRATLMFTILEAGRSLVGKRGNLLNSLFAAAFVQLMLDPMSLIDAGFQLSYLAVLGIAVLHPTLNEIWTPKGKLAFYLYQSGTLSVAATIATLPVTLYYFKSFPVWFIPANLWIVPLSTVVIVAGLVALVFSFVPLLGFLLQQLATWLAKLLVASAHFFAALPGASLTNIMFSDVETFLLAAMILGMSGYFVVRKIQFAKLAMVAALALGITGFYQYPNLGKSEELIACELRGELLLVHKTGPEMHIYSRPLTSGRADSLYSFMGNYTLTNTIDKVWWHMGQDPLSRLEYLPSGNGILRSGHKGCLVVWNSRAVDLVPDGFTIIVGRKKKRNFTTAGNLVQLNNSFAKLE